MLGSLAGVAEIGMRFSIDPVLEPSSRLEDRSLFSFAATAEGVAPATPAGESSGRSHNVHSLRELAATPARGAARRQHHPGCRKAPSLAGMVSSRLAAVIPDSGNRLTCALLAPSIRAYGPMGRSRGQGATAVVPSA